MSGQTITYKGVEYVAVHFEGAEDDDYYAETGQCHCCPFNEFAASSPLRTEERHKLCNDDVMKANRKATGKDTHGACSLAKVTWIENTEEGRTEFIRRRLTL